MIIKDLIFNSAYFIRALKHYKKSNRVRLSNKHGGVINVLGNGPSLTDCLPSLYEKKGEEFFVVNDFAISDAYPIICPKFYVMVDPCYWEEKTNDYDIQMRTKVFKSLNDKTNWDIVLYVPDYVASNQLFKHIIVNPHVNIKGFNYTNFYPTCSSFYTFILKNNWGVVPVGNILGQAIFLSLNLGFDTIRIFGADHSWTKDLRVNEKNEVCTVKRHFFSDHEILEPWHKSNRELFRMYEILGSLRNHFYGYIFLEWYAKQLNKKIINCTKGSFIDAFERSVEW